MGKQYGVELLLDLAGCDVSTFTRESLEAFYDEACDVTGMVKVKVYFWDEGRFEPDLPPHVAGISAVCFIETSNMTIHALDPLKEAYINIFTCSTFEANDVVELAKQHFRPTSIKSRCLRRGGRRALDDM